MSLTLKTRKVGEVTSGSRNVTPVGGAAIGSRISICRKDRRYGEPPKLPAPDRKQSIDGGFCRQKKVAAGGQGSPFPGKPPRDRPVSRGCVLPRRVCDDPSRATFFHRFRAAYRDSRYAFVQAWRNFSGPM